MAKTSKVVRYPIAAYCDADGIDVVICNDGTAWYLRQGEWLAMPAIPGTSAAIAEEKSDGQD